MKKLKLIAPILGIATLSSALIPLVGCSCKNTSDVQSISIKTNPTKTAFTVGEKFSSEGLTLNVVLKSGSEEVVSTGFTTNYDNKTFEDKDVGNDKDVTVTYKDKTCTYKINVNPTAASAILIYEDNKTYTADEATIYVADSRVGIKGVEKTTGAEKTWPRNEFNCKVEICEGTAQIKDNFLYRCTAFNSEVKIPSTVTSIGNSFLYECNAFNNTINIPEGVLSIGKYFLGDYSSNNVFNKELKIPSTVTSIGDSFLYGCKNFNNGETTGGTKQFVIPNSVKTIGQNFLYSCKDFNQKITFPQNNDFVSINNFFLYQCESYNQEITIPDSVTNIGPSFLVRCKNFNSKITMKKVENIDRNFMQNCNEFNNELDIFDSLKTIGNRFLSECKKFNKEIKLKSTLETIGDNFLELCYEFNNGVTDSSNKPLEIPNSVKSIGEAFLQNCNKFNQQVILPTNADFTEIKSYFLCMGNVENDSVFNKSITIPSNVTKIGSSFLQQCKGFGKDSEVTIDFSNVGVDKFTIDGSDMLKDVGDTNQIKFKVASGQVAGWTAKLQTATGKTSLPSTWTVTE